MQQFLLVGSEKKYDAIIRYKSETKSGMYEYWYIGAIEIKK